MPACASVFEHVSLVFVELVCQLVFKVGWMFSLAMQLHACGSFAVLVVEEHAIIAILKRPNDWGVCDDCI